MTLSIIREAQKNDDAAKRELFEFYGKVLFRLAKRYLVDTATTEDAVSQSFYIILKKMGGCRFAAVPAFEAWMKRIVVNECLGILRKGKWLDLPGEYESENHTADDGIVERLTAGEIFNLIEALPTGYRTVFNLYEIEGYSHGDIATMLGISAGTSKSQLSKARNMLQQQVMKLDPTYARRKSV